MSVDLLESELLRDDAKADLLFTRQLHESNEYRSYSGSSIAAVYPFLVNQKSAAGRILKSVLVGYTGDLYRRLAFQDERDFWQAPLNIEQTVRLASTYLERPLTSGDLLNAFIIAPFSEIARDYDEDAMIYEYLREKRALPKGTITENRSEMASFLVRRGINPNGLVTRLSGYGYASGEPDNVAARCSLAIGVLASGRVKVQMLDRWGIQDLAETQQLAEAPHGLWLPENILFLRSEIEEFETYLNAQPALPEEAFQEFFENHPKWLFLLGEQYEDFRAQVPLPPVQLHQELALAYEPTDETWCKPDFLLKRIGLNLWDVLDIKTSDCRMVVGRQSRRGFAWAVRDGVNQLRGYTNRLRQNDVRAYVKNKYQMEVSEPVPMLLIGREFEFKTAREMSELRYSEGVRVYTYDDVLRLAKHRAWSL
ncbi:MAG: Shedu anti-phage system protein SduA domain-containing protein [Blastocatellia bacterium]